MRYNPNCKVGLSREQVSERINDNLTNYTKTVNTKSVFTICKDNFFTLFNILNLSLGLIVFMTGSYKNALFLGVILINTLISTIQEIRAKMIIDKMRIEITPKISVIRDGKTEMVSGSDLVLDDIVYLDSGKQVLVDAIVVDGEIEVNESFITGEEDSVFKHKGDMILSGSFVVSGQCYGKVEHIKDENYVNAISLEAKYIKNINSEILKSFNKVLKFLSIVIIPLGILLFLKELLITQLPINSAIISSVAALISMIPSGLVLLTSSVMGVGALKLARHNVLVQKIYSFETLARVNTICFDKTGTITEAKMKVIDSVIYINEEEFVDIMSAICRYSKDNNATMYALKKKYNKRVKLKCNKCVPFSSERKCSTYYINKDIYKIGSEIVLKDKKCAIKTDNRELYVTKNDELIGAILLENQIKKSVVDILKYFGNNEVDIKVISGDNISTIESIMKKLDYNNLRYIDMTKVSNTDIYSLVNDYDVFGRTTPKQKKAIVQALKSLNRTVAFVGDGINDVLALKEADVSISFANASDAAKSVAEIVLLDSDFKNVPIIINEGRRTISNIERSASLFLTKTGFALLITIAFIFIPYSYPFIPIQLTLTSVFTIGIPAFILALEPNNGIIKGNFLINIIRKAIPGALMISFNILIINLFRIIFSMSDPTYSSLAVLITASSGFILLFNICTPFTNLRRVLMGLLIIAFSICFITMRDLFALSTLGINEIILYIVLFGITIYIYQLFTKLTNYLINKYVDYKN